MLAPLVRNPEKFKTVSRSVKVFRSVDLYNEFDELGNYFNNTLKAELENILNKSLITIPDKFLINVGDGNIDWVDIVSVIGENIIPLNKLQKIANNSVLCSDNQGQIFPLQCNIDYGILFGRYNNLHVWRKLVNEDIEDNTITGDKIDKLLQINLSDDLTNNFVGNDNLETKNIGDNSITSDKIIDNSLDKGSLQIQYTSDVNTGFIPIQYINDRGVDNLLAFSSGFLTPEKIMDATIYPIYNPWLFSLREYSDNPVYLHKNFDAGYEYPENYNLNVAEILESYNILSECLDDDHLIPYQNIGDLQNIPWYDNPNEARYFQQGYIMPKDDCRVEGRCIPLGQLRLRHFDDEVRNALIVKGVTDND